MQTSAPQLLYRFLTNKLTDKRRFKETIRSICWFKPWFSVIHQNLGNLAVPRRQSWRKMMSFTRKPVDSLIFKNSITENPGAQSLSWSVEYHHVKYDWMIHIHWWIFVLYTHSGKIATDWKLFYYVPHTIFSLAKLVRSKIKDTEVNSYENYILK